ncbi:right-handed parallel beta-helix repeat-containing protein [Candidatus Dependentiae bacterium]|nr:right-handed parallel beta-helix repeat-containing protein [Candidatus Dependentiae bacterium]
MKNKFLILGLTILIFSKIYSVPICTVINSPGTYGFGAGFAAQPTDADDALVCITSSNVVLDFGGEVFSQDPNFRAPGFDGVRISSNLTNITIKNGTLKNMTGIGINVGDGCSDIHVENMTIKSCDESGILLGGTSISLVQDASINNCFIKSCTGISTNPAAYGLRVTYGNDIRIDNSLVNNIDGATSLAAYALSVENSKAVSIVNCQFMDNAGNDVVAGIRIKDSDWTQISNCSVLNSVARQNSAGSRALGIFLDNSNYASILDCTSKHNNHATQSGYGFQALNGSNNLLKNCITMNNKGSVQAAGFYLNGTEVASAIIESESRANDGGAGNGYGILLDGSTKCDIFKNNIHGNKGTTEGIGLKDTAVATNNLIHGNIAFNNDTRGYKVTTATGTFQASHATIGDYTSTTTASDYYNVQFN